MRIDKPESWWRKKAEMEEGYEVTADGEMPTAPPIGPCIACAHVLPFAAWNDQFPAVGICAACLTLTLPNRGHCSHERGCDCTIDGVSWRVTDDKGRGE